MIRPIRLTRFRTNHACIAPCITVQSSCGCVSNAVANVGCQFAFYATVAISVIAIAMLSHCIRRPVAVHLGSHTSWSTSVRVGPCYPRARIVPIDRTARQLKVNLCLKWDSFACTHPNTNVSCLANSHRDFDLLSGPVVSLGTLRWIQQPQACSCLSWWVDQ